MKRKLLLAAVALLCSVGMWATDYRSSLPANGVNWDITSSGPWRGNENMTNDAPKGQCEVMSDYKFAEVYYNKATGTEFEIYKTISVPNGVYIFQMAAYGRWANMEGHENGTTDNINGVVFANDATVAITSGTFVYYTVTTVVTDGTLKVGIRANSGNKPNWWGYADPRLILVDVGETDLTSLLVNPSFETGNSTGWTHTTSNDTKVTTSTGNYATTGLDGSYLFNTWWQGVPITQTVANMPNGNYTLKALLASSNGDADAKLFLLAQDGHSDLITVTQGTSGTFSDYTYDFTVSNNSVTIGAVGGNDDGSYNASGHWWYKADNFRITYKGGVYSTLLSNTVTKAQALVNGNTIPNAAETALQTVINDNGNDDAFTTVKQYMDAIAAINTAYDTYKALEAKYAIWLEVKAGATAMKDVENNNATATSTLNTAIGTQNTAAEGATTNDGLNTAIAALRSAILAFAKDAVPTSGNRFDLTCLLTNHDLTGLSTWAKADGWYTEQSGGNSQVMNGSNKYFYEYWSDQTTPATSGYTVYLKTTLPKGVYSMSAQAFATDQRSDAAKEENPTVDGISFSANEVDGTSITHEGTDLAAASISFYQASESEVKLGLKAHIGNTRNWMGIGYVQLYKEANDQAAGVYATVRTSANNALNSAEYTNVTGKERSDLATLAAVETPADYVEAIEDLQEANSTFVSAKATYDTWATSTITQNTTNVGTGVFQLDETRNNSLYSAYETARNHEITSSTVASDVAEWNTAVATAISNYNDQALNAPSPDKRYVLTIVENGKAWNGNAVTFIEGARNDQGGYGIKYLAPANANLNQALKFTAIDGYANTYKVSAINVADGAERYITTGSTYSGNNSQIRTTDDASKASWIKIQATTTNGQFQLLNVSDGNKVIANNNNNDMYTANSANFTIAEATQASVNITIDADVQYATRIFPFTPELPSGVKAYSCNALVGDKLTLVEVAEPQANVPYILEAENGYTGEALTGWGIAGKTTYTQGLLTGVYESTTAAAGTYVLQKNNGKVAFYLVETDQEPTIGANRAYLTDGSGSAKARAYFFDGDASAIETISALTAGEVETIYNAAGVQVKSLQKGMNIVVLKNGQTQKVYVK